MVIVKSEEQIAGIRKSCYLAADTLRFIESEVKAGRTTEQINHVAETYIRDHGAIPAPLNYHGFPKATCISLNEVVCHGIPGEETVLEDGDIVKIDVTTILDGYYGDTCTTFAVGQVSEAANRLMAVCRDCLSIGISQIRPRNEIWQIGHAITGYATKRGYSVVQSFCGHGTGVEFHEEPVVCHHYNPRERNTLKMVPGHIFTVEPMINEGGYEVIVDPLDKWTVRTKDLKLSAQYEHTCLVTDTGVEVLTQ